MKITDFEAEESCLQSEASRRQKASRGKINILSLYGTWLGKLFSCTSRRKRVNDFR